MANVGDLDHVVANPIKELVRIPHYELYPHLRIVRFVTAVRVLTEQSHCFADTLQHTAGPIG
jgi:hypothetical protein